MLYCHFIMNNPAEAKRPVWVELVTPKRSVHIGFNPDGTELIKGRTRTREESPLPNVPHNSGESLLSVPGLHDLYIGLREATGMRSQARGRARKTLLGNAAAAVIDERPEGADYLRNLDILSDPEIVANEQVIAEARLMREKLQERIGRDRRRQQDIVYDSGADIFKPEADADLTAREVVVHLKDRVNNFRHLEEEEQMESARQEARELLRDPEHVVRRYDTFTAVRQSGLFSERGEADQAHYEDMLSMAVIDVMTNESPPYPTREGMEHWISRWVKKTEASEEQFTEGRPALKGEPVLRKLIQGASTPEEVTNVLYDMALAGFSTGDPDVMMQTARLLSWQTDLMPLYSQQGIDREFACFSIDPETKQKANEIQDAVLGFFSINSARDQLTLWANIRKMFHNTDFLRLMGRQVTNYPDEMRKMGWESKSKGGKVHLARVIGQEGTKYTEKVRKGGLPAAYATHDTQVGPLGDWLRDHYASFSTLMRAVAPLGRRRTVLAHLNFPDQPATEVSKLSADEAASQVRDHLWTTTYDQPIEDATYWNTLGYLAPEKTGSRKWAAIQLENYVLRREMKQDQRHSLSPLGDRLEVVNPVLKKLGFHSIDFVMDRLQRDMTIVTLQVGNATFRCLLDQDLHFREAGSRHNLGLRQYAPFLEFALLSHLYQIYNAEPSRKVPGQVDSGPPIDVVHRRAHRRRLLPGQNPTADQIIKIMDEYGIYIPVINDDRRARGEERMITWVSEVKPDLFSPANFGQNPVIHKGEKANDIISNVI